MSWQVVKYTGKVKQYFCIDPVDSKEGSSAEYWTWNPGQAMLFSSHEACERALVLRGQKVTGTEFEWVRDER